MSHHFTVDGISEELFAARNHWTREQQGRGGFIKQFKRPVVDADVVHLQEELGGRRGGAEDLCHVVAAVSLPLVSYTQILIETISSVFVV